MLASLEDSEQEIASHLLTVQILIRTHSRLAISFVLDCFVISLWQNVFDNFENVLRIFSPNKCIQHHKIGNLDIDAEVLQI